MPPWFFSQGFMNYFIYGLYKNVILFSIEFQGKCKRIQFMLKDRFYLLLILVKIDHDSDFLAIIEHPQDELDPVITYATVVLFHNHSPSLQLETHSINQPESLTLLTIRHLIRALIFFLLAVIVKLV